MKDLPKIILIGESTFTQTVIADLLARGHSPEDLFASESREHRIASVLSNCTAPDIIFVQVDSPTQLTQAITAIINHAHDLSTFLLCAVDPRNVAKKSLASNSLRVRLVNDCANGKLLITAISQLCRLLPELLKIKTGNTLEIRELPVENALAEQQITWEELAAAVASSRTPSTPADAIPLLSGRLGLMDVLIPPMPKIEPDPEFFAPLFADGKPTNIDVAKAHSVYINKIKIAFFPREHALFLKLHANNWCIPLAKSGVSPQEIASVIKEMNFHMEKISWRVDVGVRDDIEVIYLKLKPGARPKRYDEKGSPIGQEDGQTTKKATRAPVRTVRQSWMDASSHDGAVGEEAGLDTTDLDTFMPRQVKAPGAQIRSGCLVFDMSEGKAARLSVLYLPPNEFDLLCRVFKSAKDGLLCEYDSQVKSKNSRGIPDAIKRINHQIGKRGFQIVIDEGATAGTSVYRLRLTRCEITRRARKKAA